MLTGQKPLSVCSFVRENFQLRWTSVQLSMPTSSRKIASSKEPSPVSERIRKHFKSLVAQIDGGHLKNAIKTCDKSTFQNRNLYVYYTNFTSSSSGAKRSRCTANETHTFTPHRSTCTCTCFVGDTHRRRTRDNIPTPVWKSLRIIPFES